MADCDINKLTSEKTNQLQQIVEITTTANDKILQTFCYDINIKQLKDEIDKQKYRTRWYPQWTLIWSGATIVFEDFYSNFPNIKEMYANALRIGNQSEKDAALEKATKKLIQYILAVASMNKKDEIKVNDTPCEIDINQFERLLCSRDQVADQIKSQRKKPWTITLRDWVTINLQDPTYQNIFTEYKDKYTKNAQEDEKIDAQIAERIILENDLIVQINNPLIDYTDKNYKDEDNLNQNLNAGYNGLKGVWIETRKIKVQKGGKSYRALQKVDSNNIISTDWWVNRDQLAKNISIKRQDFLNGTAIDFYGNEKLNINELNVQINSSYQATIGTHYKDEYKKTSEPKEIEKLDTRLAELAILLKGKMIQIDNYALNPNDPNYKTPIEIKRNQDTCYICLNNITIPVKEKTVTINGKKHYLVYLDRSKPITITTTDTQQQQAQEQTPPVQQPQPQPENVPPATPDITRLIQQQRTQQQQQPQQQNQAPLTPNQTQNTVTQNVESAEQMLSKCVNRDNLATQINNLNGNLNGELRIRNDKKINLNDPKYQQYIQWYKGTYSTNDHNKIEKANTELAELLILASGCYIQINNNSIGPGDPNYGNYANKQMNCINEINSHHNSDSKNYPFEVEGRNFNYNNTQYYIVKPKISTIVPPQIPTPPNTGGTGEGIGTINIDNSSNQYRLNIINQQNNQIKELTKQIEKLKAIIKQITINGGGGWDQPKPEEKPTGDVDKPEPKPKPEKDPIPPKTEKPEPEKKPETPKEDPIEEVGEFELDAVLTDAKDTYQEKVRKEVENEINEDYHNTGQWKVFKKFWTFMSRGFKRKKKIAEKMKEMEGTPFVVNDEEMNQELESIANRHDLEEKFYKSKMGVFGKIQRTKLIDTAKDTINEREKGPGIKDLCKKYLTTDYKKEDFQQDFNEYIQENYDIPKENQFFATNILNKLDTIKADNDLFKKLEKNISDWKRDEVKTECNKYFSKYKKDPRFRNELYELMGEAQKGNLSAEDQKKLDEKIKKFIRHQKAIANASVNNLRIKMDLLTNGKAAHRINNKDRKNRLFKIGHKFDKLPRWGQLMTAAWIGVAGMGVAALGGWAIAATATTAWLSGLFAAIKKMTHYTKEQNTFEKDLATDYEKTKNKIRQWEATVQNENARRRDRYKAKRQLKLYKEATQNKLIEDKDEKAETTQLVDALHQLIENTKSREEIEKDPKNQLLIADIAARLEAYRRTGHNFLRSNDGTEMEQKFYELENALQTISNRYYDKKLDTRMKARRINQKNEKGEDVTDKDGKPSTYKYSDLVTAYCTDYSKASKKFRAQLALLGLKYGVGTAVLSAWTSLWIQKLTGSGIVAEGPKTEVTTIAWQETTQEVTEFTKANATGNFDLWSFELTDNNAIQNLAHDNIAGLSSNDTVTLHFWGGTDATPIRINWDFSSIKVNDIYNEKLNQVIKAIRKSKIQNGSELIHQLQNWQRQDSWQQVNDMLHHLRCLETIEETVKGSWNFSGTLNIQYDSSLTTNATTAYNESERIGKALLEIHKKSIVPWIQWWTGEITIPGTGNKNLIFSIPFFANTFYDNGTPPETKEKEPKAAVKGEETKTDGKKDEEPKGGENPDNLKGEPEGKEPKEEEEKSDWNTGNNPDNKNGEKGTPSPQPKSKLQPAETSKPDAEKAKKEIRDNIDKVLKGELEEEEFNETYKDNKDVLEQLKQEKEFRKEFPTYNFYKQSEVDKLKEKYKDNQEILDRINIETTTKLDTEYQKLLKEDDVEKYKKKAKDLVDEALKDDKNCKRFWEHPMIVIKLSDELTIPFYKSSWKWGKLWVPKDKFYPVFGIGDDEVRLNKGHQCEINNFYSSPLLAAIAQELNQKDKDKKLKIDKRQNNTKEFNKRANTWKKPVDSEWKYDDKYKNINDTLKKVAEIKPND